MLGVSASPVYALVLFAVTVWGLAPVLTKLGLNRGAEPRQAALVVLAVDTATASLCYLALYGADALARLSGLDTRVLALFALTGALGTGLGRLVGLVGIERLGASVHSAVLSVRPLFATALGVVFLGERAGPVTVVGVVVIVLGVATLERARTRGGGERSGWERFDLLFPLGAAATYAVSRVVRRAGLRLGELTPLAAVVVNEVAGLLVLGAVLVGLYGRDAVAVPRVSLPYLLANGVCLAAGMVAVFTALSSPAGRVVLVDPLVATIPLFTVGFAARLLETEHITRGVVVGAGLAVLGAALVVR